MTVSERKMGIADRQECRYRVIEAAPEELVLEHDEGLGEIPYLAV